MLTKKNVIGLSFSSAVIDIICKISGKFNSIFKLDFKCTEFNIK